MAYQNAKPQSSYIPDTTIEKDHPDLYARIRAVLGERGVRITVRAGGPLLGGEKLLGDALAWQLRDALETPRYGGVAVYFRSLVAEHKRLAQASVVQWLHYTRGHTQRAIADVLRISPSHIAHNLLASGADRRHGRMPYEYSEELAAAGIPFVEQAVLGAVRPADVSLDDRCAALAAAEGTTPAAARRRAYKAGAALRDLRSLSPQQQEDAATASGAS